eukprot:scaffold549_cov150-Skeletonema_dohrnii-CCMP3373.AAC.2
MLGGVGFGNSQIGVEHFLKEGHSFPVADNSVHQNAFRAQTPENSPKTKAVPDDVTNLPTIHHACRDSYLESRRQTSPTRRIPTSAWGHARVYFHIFLPLMNMSSAFET